ncbi:hypothetical protein FSARC_3033 [Fusarium sarcochroum]|uniref:Uncharacterized protein n=1 Tax=Fusarium sarcochroum TaxID=1208366 RepID=A0A8H4U4W1_9HYPO|nr:hypothetical protein FSARC_3033 [Fusarium sarcochroum]
MASRILQDSGILELLNCLRSSNSSDANPEDAESHPNADCPEQVKEEEDNGRPSHDITLLDWPAFARQQIPLTSLKVILHAIHSDDWARATTKSQLTGRLLTLFVRFGLGTRIEEPWLLFLYIGQTVPFNIRLIKTLNTWMTESGHIDYTIVPFAITTQAINRHGRQNPSPYQILDVDIERAIQYLTQQIPRPPPDPEREASSQLRSRASSRYSPSAASEQSQRFGNANQLEQRLNTPIRISGSVAALSPSVRVTDVDNGSGNRASNGRKRPYQDHRERSQSSVATPEIGRRTTHATPFASPLAQLPLPLNRLVSSSPNANFSGSLGFDQTSPSYHEGTLRLKSRLDALQAVIELGPAVEVDVDSPLARQTRGLLDSITHLAQVAFDTIGEVGRE